MYRLNEDGKWDDQGTGHVTVDYLEVLEQSSFPCVCFSLHDDVCMPNLLLKQCSLWCRGQRTWVCLLLMRRIMKHYYCIASAQMIFIVSKKVSFCKLSLSFMRLYDQFCSICYILHFTCSDTIISWRDPEFSTELALSFQETTGCSYIWLVFNSTFLYMTLCATRLTNSLFYLYLCRDHICSLQRNMHFSSLASKFL